jgi:hypothetical protein
MTELPVPWFISVYYILLTIFNSMPIPILILLYILFSYVMFAFEIRLIYILDKDNIKMHRNVGLALWHMAPIIWPIMLIVCIITCVTKINIIRKSIHFIEQLIIGK